MVTRWSVGRGRGEREDGSAIVAAVFIGLIVATVITTAAARSIGESTASAARIERHQAVALAELGIATAIGRLDGGLALELRGSPVAHTVTIDVEVPTGHPTGVGLDVQVTSSPSEEALEIISAASVGRSTHRVVARVRPQVTSDFLVLSAFESLDPALFTTARATCALTRGDDRRPSGCRGVDHAGRVLDGPVHSNDALLLGAGAVVGSQLTTSHLVVDPDGRVLPALWPGSDPEPVSAPPFGLEHRGEVDLPSGIRDVSATQVVTCRFRGPTLLRFLGEEVRVTSPRSIPRPGDALDDPLPLGCGEVDRAALGAPTTIVLPDRAVIEIVRDTVHDCADHPLGIGPSEDSERDWWCNGGDAFVWGTYEGARTVLAEDSIQIVWDLVPTVEPDGVGRRQGDLLGLVAGDSIVLRRPVGRVVRRVYPYGQNLPFAGSGIPPFGDHPNDAPNASASTWDSPAIVASLVALRGSIGIQNPLRGERHPGLLVIEGSLANRFHGIFGWEDRTTAGVVEGVMGYSHELRYDRRLLADQPPALPLTAAGAVRVLELRSGPSGSP